MARRRAVIGRESSGDGWASLLPLLPVAIVLGFATIVVLGSFYTVDAFEQAVVLRFGRYMATMPPGLHFKVPLVDRVYKVSTEEHSLRLPYGEGQTRPYENEEDETLMLTGDLSAASVEWTLQWRVSKPEDYLFRFPTGVPGSDAEQVVITVAKTVMNRLVGDYSIDEVLTEKRSDIAYEAQKETQRILDEFKCGIVIPALQMQRVTPPAKVKPSFDHVNASLQERDRLENEANKERYRILPAALAEKDKLIRDAQGYADRRRAEATGEIEALLARYQAYARAPDITRERLYLESMQEVLSNIGAKTIIDGDIHQVLPLLNLDQGASP